MGDIKFTYDPSKSKYAPVLDIARSGDASRARSFVYSLIDYFTQMGQHKPYGEMINQVLLCIEWYADEFEEADKKLILDLFTLELFTSENGNYFKDSETNRPTMA